MSTWAILAAYVVGWYLAAPRVAREFPSHGRPYCHGDSKSGNDYGWGHDRIAHDRCQRWCKEGCWHSDQKPAFRAASAAMALALAWPVLLLVADVARRAKGKPSRNDLTKSIADLERELGMDGDR